MKSEAIALKDKKNRFNTLNLVAINSDCLIERGTFEILIFKLMLF